MGTNGDHLLQLIFWFDAGSSFNSRTNSLGQQSGTFDIAQVQLEQGSLATPFEHRPIGMELALCQRYYQIMMSTSINRYQTIGSCFSNDWCFLRMPTVVQMRAGTNIINNSLSLSIASGTTQVTDAVFFTGGNYSDARGLGMRWDKTAGFVAGRAAHVDVSSGSIALESEL